MAKIKVGDKLFVKKKGKHDWVSEMSELIGKEVTVSHIKRYVEHTDVYSFGIKESIYTFYSDACVKVTKKGKHKKITGFKDVKND